VKTIAFVAANESDPPQSARRRRRGRARARPAGRRRQGHLPNDTRDFTPVLTAIVKLKPDLLVLSGVSPANAPLLIRAARELGYQGLLSAETAQDAKVLEEGAGDLAKRLHLGRRRLDCGDPLQDDGRLHRALHQDVRRIQRRVEH